MTLIVALRHQEGLVLASDSQATADTSGQATKQETDKLFLLGGVMGWGGSGSEGLVQRLQHDLEKSQHEIRQGFAKHGAEDGANKLFPIVNQIQHQALKELIQPFSREPQALAVLFAGYAHGQPFILEIARNGTRQFHNAPYAAIGSGDIFAVHAIRSVAHYDVTSLSQDRALALAYRTVDNAIRTAAYFLGGRVQLLAITQEKAWCLTEGETRVVEDLVDIWKQKEVEVLGSLSSAPGPPAPPPAVEEPPRE